MRLGEANSAIPRHWMNLHSNETYFWITLAPILSLTVKRTELPPWTLRMATYIRILLKERHIYTPNRNDFNSFSTPCLHRRGDKLKTSTLILITSLKLTEISNKKFSKTSNFSNLINFGKSGAFALVGCNGGWLPVFRNSPSVPIKRQAVLKCGRDRLFRNVGDQAASRIISG